MTDHDKPEFFARLNGIMEVFNKPKLTPSAAQVWWDTMRDLDHNDTFTVLGYWAQTNSRPPTPKDVWSMANESRTNRLEAKAAVERAENRDPFGTHWSGPTKYGREMIRLIHDMLQRGPQGNREPKWPISMRKKS